MENLDYQLNPKKESNLHRASEAFAKWVISAYLKANEGNVMTCSKLLGVSRTTLHEMIKRLGLCHLKKRKPRKKKGDLQNGKS